MTDTPVAVHILPEPHDPPAESSARALGLHSIIQCKRLLLTWRRDLSTLIQALIYPAITLLMLRVVLGDSITMATGQPSIYGTVPMITLIGAMSGSVVSALGLREERRVGLLSRFWTLPIHRAAGLVGRLLAEAVRVFVTTIVILIAGVLLGFRFDQGFLAGVALVFLPVMFGVGFAVMVTALATLTGDAPVVEIIGVILTLLMFFNSGFVPVSAYPVWLQNFVQYQPLSCAIDAMKGLSLGGPVAEPLMLTVAWSVGITAVFLWPAVIGYRRAAERGG